jgi:hypothetical protein
MLISSFKAIQMICEILERGGGVSKVSYRLHLHFETLVFCAVGSEKFCVTASYRHFIFFLMHLIVQDKLRSSTSDKKMSPVGGGGDRKSAKKVSRIT